MQVIVAKENKTLWIVTRGEEIIIFFAETNAEGFEVRTGRVIFQSPLPLDPSRIPEAINVISGIWKSLDLARMVQGFLGNLCEQKTNGHRPSSELTAVS